VVCERAADELTVEVHSRTYGPQPFWNKFKVLC